jgi:hypothetical protein
VEVFDPTSTRGYLLKSAFTSSFTFTFTSLSGDLLVFYYLRPTAYEAPNSRVQFLVSVETVFYIRVVSETCMSRCLANWIDPFLAPLFRLLGGVYRAVA